MVVAAVIERGGRLLISQRGEGGGHPGHWEFPGGKREPGEGDRAALRRELREELQIAASVGPRVWTTVAGPLELRFFRCRYPAHGRPRAVGCAQFRWVPRPDLARLAFPPADAELVAALVEGRV